MRFIPLVFFALFLSCTREKYELPPPPVAVEGQDKQHKVEVSGEEPTAAGQTIEIETKIETKDQGNKETKETKISATVTSPLESILSFKTQGHVEKILVRSGDIVKKGQVLAQLDNSDALLNEKAASMALATKRLAFTQAKKDLARAREQFANQVIAPSQLEKIENAFTTAEYEAQQAVLELAKKKNILSFTKLHAPFEGVISQTYKNDGDFVNLGDQVLKIVDVAELEVQAKFPESFLGKIKVGTRVPFVSPVQGDSFVGELEIIRIVPILDSKTRTFDAFASIKKGGEKLVPGEFIELKI